MNRLQRFIYRLKEEYRKHKWWANIFQIIHISYLKSKESDYIKHNDETQNFCITIVQSPQWIAWDKVAHLRGWDTAESAECGWLSKEHLSKFLDFVKNEYNE